MTEVGRLNTELVTPINGINPDRYFTWTFQCVIIQKYTLGPHSCNLNKINVTSYIKINSPQSPRPRVVRLHLDDRETILHRCSCSEASPQNVPLCLASTSFHQWTTALRNMNVNYFSR